MLRSRKQRDLKRARLAPAGLLLSFSGAYSTVDPSAFEMLYVFDDYRCGAAARFAFKRALVVMREVRARSESATSAFGTYRKVGVLFLAVCRKSF